MMVLGLIIGFVGAGGAGVMIAILTVFFGIPIHTAIATALSSMIFTSMSGSVSHLREGNVAIRCGAAVAFMGVKVASLIPPMELVLFTGAMLFLSSLTLAARMFYFSNAVLPMRDDIRKGTGARFWALACGFGLICGFFSGAFGIGAAPFIQVGLLIIFGLSVRKVAGTTMFILVPVAFTGGVGYLLEGHLDISLLIHVVAGMMVGTYIGAKFTKRLSPVILKTAMVVVPILGALLLWFG
jgi:uncharacterized membrane protein YfcA